MKKVYETTREFEAAVRAAFMVPPQQLDAFLTIFEEARCSDHNIGVMQRDQAISTLGAIDFITSALGEEGQVKRYEASGCMINKPKQENLSLLMVQFVKLELLKANPQTSRFDF